MKVIDTGYVDILCQSTSSDNSNPLTDALNFLEVKEAEIDVFVRACTTKAKVRIGIAYSDNPFDFSGATVAAFSGTYLAVANLGWNYKAYSGVLGSLATPKMFVRFVALGRLDSSGVTGEGMQIRVVIRIPDLRTRVVSGPRRRINTKGSSTAGQEAIIPLTDTFETSGLVAHRLWRELVSMPALTAMDVTFGYQETDTPDDPTSWGTFNALGSTYNTDVVVMPTGFSAVTFSKRYARYVVKAINAAGFGNAIESGHAMLRAELRGC